MHTAISIDELIRYLETLAPPELAEKWDNCGLLVRAGGIASKVLIALDITHAVLSEAIEKGCDVIVSHHPVIFAPLYRLEKNSVAAGLIRSNISAICLHTSLDAAVGGVNDVLAQTLGLKSIEPMAPIGSIGRLTNTQSCRELAQLCQKLLGAKVSYTPCCEPITRVAVVGGVGGEYIQQAKQAGADCLITGEVKYHEAQEAQALGISLIAAGHYATEVPVCAYLKSCIELRFAGLNVSLAAQGSDIFEYL